MNLTEARILVRENSLNAGSSSSYSDAQIDRVIMSVGKILYDDLNYIRICSPVTFNAGSQTIDLETLFDLGFSPDRIQGFYLVSGNTWTSKIGVTDMQTIAQLRTPNNPTNSAGQPQEIAFKQTADTFAQVFPTPSTSNSYDAEIMWHGVFQSWTAGTDGDTVTFDPPLYPDSVMQAMLTQGCPAVLQKPEPEKAAVVLQSQAWFKEIIRKLGLSSLGGNMVVPRGILGGGRR